MPKWQNNIMVSVQKGIKVIPKLVFTGPVFYSSNYFNGSLLPTAENSHASAKHSIIWPN